MRITDFDIYRDLLLKYSGYSISQDKAYLLDSRLTPVAKKWGYHSLEGFTLSLRGVPDPEVIKDVVEAMTINETSFFLDQKPFDLFIDTVLPYLNAKRKKSHTLRIWCAACSTGQEPYSLALLLKENPQLSNGRRVEIIATDIADEALSKAKEGLFSQFEVQRGLPVQMLLKYFVQDGDNWRLNEEVRQMVAFEKLNLIEDFSFFGTFDVIFCRNVLTYFEDETKRDILDRIAQQLADDGFLYLSGAESTVGISDSYQMLAGKHGLHILKDGKYDMRELSV